MSTPAEHEAEQAAITAMCEAGECDHPECIREYDERRADRQKALEMAMDGLRLYWVEHAVEGIGDDLDLIVQAYSEDEARALWQTMYGETDGPDEIRDLGPIKAEARAVPWFPEARDPYQTELVDRSAPRWAWEIIDETLAMDANSKAFDGELRQQIGDAYQAMIDACANPEA